MIPLIDYKELHKIIDEVYQLSADKNLSWVEFAEAAGISCATVYRLGNYQTKYPRIQTVMMLAKAVGMELKLGMNLGPTRLRRVV